MDENENTDQIQWGNIAMMAKPPPALRTASF